MIWQDLLLLCCALAFASYLGWYYFSAKTSHPLNWNDLVLTWKLHKKQTGCNSEHFQSVCNNGNKELVGFKCDCGYEYRQKRLIAQKTLKQETPVQLSQNLATAVEEKN